MHVSYTMHEIHVSIYVYIKRMLLDSCHLHAFYNV